jgi:hypothetical protein
MSKRKDELHYARKKALRRGGFAEANRLRWLIRRPWLSKDFRKPDA